MRRGHATVELILIFPLFMLLIGFAGFHGSLSRLVGASPWIVDTLMVFPDNSSLEECATLRGVDSNLTRDEAMALWRAGVPKDETAAEVDSLVSADNEWETLGSTNQDGDYTDDVVALEEEAVRLEQRITVGFDNFGRITMTTQDSVERQLWASLRSTMDDDALEDSDSASWEMPEGRSRHREGGIEYDLKAWLPPLLDGADDAATLRETARVRVRSHESVTPWLLDTVDDFHGVLDDILVGMGEEGATLEPTPYWDDLRWFREPN